MDCQDTEPENERSFARELRLARRRSRLPWVYAVYHRQPRGPGPPQVCRRRKAGTSSGELASKTFSAVATADARAPTAGSDSSTAGRRLTPTMGGALA